MGVTENQTATHQCSSTPRRARGTCQDLQSMQQHELGRSPTDEIERRIARGATETATAAANKQAQLNANSISAVEATPPKPEWNTNSNVQKNWEEAYRGTTP